MDKIKQLTIEELIKIAYEHRCFECLCEVSEGWKDKNPNYWGCNGGCERKCCDDCFEPDEDDEDNIEGFICEHCRKEEKEEDKSK